MSTDGFVPLHTVTLTLCEPCINGAGGECHSPGCDLWIHQAPDIPILAAQEQLKTPDEWQEITEVRVMDPDGWRCDGRSWSHPLTEEEFRSRAMLSTRYGGASPRKASPT